MKQINNIEDFFDDHMFKDTILFGFKYSSVEKDFYLILNDPNVLDKELRVFLKLKFSGVRNYEREPGLFKEKSFVERYQKTKNGGVVDIRELTVAKERATDKWTFYLDLGVSHGDIFFYFDDLYLELKKAMVKKVDDTYAFFDSSTNDEIDFYNPFDLSNK